ncbi:MAG: cytosine deaminase [Hyphomicrobiaceae bacterium]
MHWRTKFDDLPRDRVTLQRATVPVCLVDGDALAGDAEGLVLVDIEIAEGRIAAITAAGTKPTTAPSIDLDRGMVWPGFVECHTHLDKGHIWPRASNPNGSFQGALETVMADRAANWSASDLMPRMEFALRCAYAHGTTAIRTHLDSRIEQTHITWPVYAELKDRWRDRIQLDASPLFPIDLALDDIHMSDVTAAIAAHGQTLGAVTYMTPNLAAGIDRLFRVASDRGWNLDFHVDESLDSTATSLRTIAETALRYRFQGQVLVGHCCSLSVQPESEVAATMDLMAKSNIAVVSLPMCNMYLQDRHAGRTPRGRGVTLLHELRARGIKVAVASDNTRDPFYAYGDLDALEVFREAVRIAHLDHPFGEWSGAITRVPADIMGFFGHGRIARGAAADLVSMPARTWTELLSRPQSNRAVLRSGRLIGADLPDYRELDPLFG